MTPAARVQAAIELLARAAAWQGLDEVRVSGVGNLPLPERFEASPSV